ncbi:MAG: hypothetical protein ATN35_05440 [Epulopiscium sp. Nele67-Bin004]|nr:MAG: hypothetical protein ATN35_05440 [Epulopiscium sp. Nele67-Bin004]
MKIYEPDIYKIERIGGEDKLLTLPRIEHALIIGTLHSIINMNISDKYIVFADCISIKFDEENIFVPDLTVIKKSSIIKGKVEGMPKLVVEVWSLSNKPAEREKKLEIYARKGIPQFIEIDYLKREVVSNKLIDGAYQIVKKIDVYPLYEYEIEDVLNKVDHGITIECVQMKVDMLDVFNNDIKNYIPYR